MTYKQWNNQHFLIREQKYGHVPMVDVVTWFGEGNKCSIGVYTQNLKELRDAINDYLGDTCDCDWDD